MKNSEVRELSDKELVEKIENEETHLVKMRLNHAVSPLDNPNKLKESRRNIARLKTELKKRQLAEMQKSE
ncbi:MAG: 50S ribosomal protein L29 [Bacteroidales bacterium]|nr:50S ribosomal protein L29 [Bacteroidales bacterium]